MRRGLAVAIDNCPFTIRLKYDVDNLKQSVYYGADTGRENIGGAASDGTGNCLHMSQLKTSNKSIKIKMCSRAQQRRERKRHKRIKKQRKAARDCVTIKNGKDDIVRNKKKCKSIEISYPGVEKSRTHKVIRGAEAQFNNRTTKEGWITPSARQLIQMHILMLEKARKFLPITHVCLERVCFDFQKLENADIKAWEYSKGPMYGFKDYKEYVNARQGGQCPICGKNHIDEYHHIIPKSQGGSDMVGNIIGLCYDCHQKTNGVHKDKDAQNMLLDLVGEFGRSYGISLLNSVMPALIEAMQKYCDERNLILIITNGYETARTRKALGLDANKTDEDSAHHVDAYCISLAGRELPNMSNVSMPDVLHCQQRFKKKSNNNIKKRNQREYWFDDKCVAKNRHKATEQTEDSLEEYLVKYADAHTEAELAMHMHELSIKPAARVYTFHKEWKIPPIHPGDTVKYEKKNKVKGNTKIATFVATSVRMDEEKVEHGTKTKRLKYCRRIKSGCTPCINAVDINISSTK
jgi:hypothetical protein